VEQYGIKTLHCIIIIIITVLLSLDIGLSAAFETVLYSSLLDRALSDFGMDGVTLD